MRIAGNMHQHVLGGSAQHAFIEDIEHDNLLQCAAEQVQLHGHDRIAVETAQPTHAAQPGH
ncbi:hypothetical protein D3C78_1840260 [compost metagenome]